MKLFPIAALPLLALRERRRSIGRAVAVIAVGLAVLAVVDGPAVLAPYSLQSYGQHPYHQASWNVDPIWLAFATVASLVADLATIDRLVTAISAAGLVASYLWWCVRPAARGADPIPLFWRAVILILLWSRLYSPQYSLWVLPAFVLFVPRPGLLLLLAPRRPRDVRSDLHARRGRRRPLRQRAVDAARRPHAVRRARTPRRARAPAPRSALRSRSRYVRGCALRAAIVGRRRRVEARS